MTTQGCPKSKSGSVSAGFIIRKSSTEIPSSISNTDLSINGTAVFLKEDICIHSTDGGNSGTSPFPPGGYCVYKSGQKNCPDGFQEVSGMNVVHAIGEYDEIIQFAEGLCAFSSRLYIYICISVLSLWFM